MIIKQVSVFIENKEGRILDITRVLKENDIDIKTLSLADTTEYGMIRLIVSDCEKAKAVLKAEGFPVSITDVVAVKAEGRVGFLHDMLVKMKKALSNIEYMYTLPGEDGIPVVILKVSNPEEVDRLL